MNHSRDERGFTLLEVVISTAILILITGAIFHLFTNQMRAREVTTNFMLVSEHNQRALQKIAEELKGTDNQFVNVSLTGAQGARTLQPLVPSGTPITVNLFSEITFKRIDGFDIAEGTQLWSSDIVFRRDAANRYVVRIQDGNTQILASYADELSFYFNGSGGIGVMLTTSHGNVGGLNATGAQVQNRLEVYPVNAGTN